MFGFIRGDRGDKQYRALYARACQAHFINNGRLASVFHSFEAVFLFALACDLGLVEAPQDSDPTCCKLRRRFKVTQKEMEIGQFCSAFAMLLVRIKLQDDWQDDRSLASFIGLRIFRRPIRAALSYFQSIDPEFGERLEVILDEHQALELQPASLIELEQFQAATRKGFGYIFNLFARRWLDEDRVVAVEQIGQRLGEAIIAFDCAVDWKNDQRRKRFNPLRNAQQVRQALLSSSQSLIRAADLLNGLDASTEREPVCRRVLARQVRLILHRANAQVFQQIHSCTSEGSSSTVSNSAVSNSAGTMMVLRRGDCDICCAITACDGCACDALTCDAIACDAGFCHLCECCFYTDGCSGNSKKKQPRDKESKSSSPNSQKFRELVGSHGTTSGPLNPSGLVCINEQYYPASSYAGNEIEANSSILVVDADTFGLRVKEDRYE